MEHLKVISGGEADIAGVMAALGRDAQKAVRALALLSHDARSTALRTAAAALRGRAAEIITANGRDLAEAKARGTTAAFGTSGQAA